MATKRTLNGDRKLGVTLVLFAGVCWSLSGIIFRWIETASPWQVLFFRSSSLFIFLLIILLFRYRANILGLLQTTSTASIIGGGCLGVAFTGYILALDLTTVANAMFVLAAAPFFSAIIGRVLLNERITRNTWFAMFLAAIGLAIMTNGEIKSGSGAGNFFALLAALGFAGMTISLRYQKNVDKLPTILYGSIFASVFSLVGVLIYQDGFRLLPMDLIYSVSLGIFQIGFGFLLFTAGARHLLAVELTLLSLTEIIVGPILVWIGIGEIPTKATMIGGSIIISAIILVAIFGSINSQAPGQHQSDVISHKKN